jgi:hypothetical protein
MGILNRVSSAYPLPHPPALHHPATEKKQNKHDREIEITRLGHIRRWAHPRGSMLRHERASYAHVGRLHT